MRFLAAALLVLGVAACGPPAPRQAAPQSSAAPVQPPEKPMSESERALRAQARAYYADFIKTPEFKIYAPGALGLSVKNAKRFDRAMAVQSPAVIASSDGLAALVFSGCVAHNCGDTSGVLAIDVSSREVFAGVRDEAGTAVLKPNPRLQKLLEDVSPSREWSNPPRAN